MDVDFAKLYGPEWAHLAGAEPSHVTLAQGSDVRVLAPDAASATNVRHRDATS
jgi:hypothetical protein